MKRTQECEKVNNENVVNVSSKHSSLVETFKTSTTITCSFCMIAVNLAKKFITKPSVFQLIHGIVTEMCSVVEGYKMECYDVASQIVDSYMIVFNRTESLDTCLQVNFCN
ncbi:unnamed protein product [Heterobilharzia americana]|nr:unnamed protein product [Heterobilharzia americana]